MCEFIWTHPSIGQISSAGRNTLSCGFVSLLVESLNFVGIIWADRASFSRRSSTSCGGRSFLYSLGHNVKSPGHFLYLLGEIPSPGLLDVLPKRLVINFPSPGLMGAL